jgi:hypothetical protein
MRSTYDWSSQGGKLPRCVLPRTGAADAAEAADAAYVRALQWTPQDLSERISWQGSRQKAAQTSSVAARLTAVQPSPQGVAERIPAGLRPAPLWGRCLVRGRSERGVSPYRCPSAGSGSTGLPAVGLSQARKLADVSVPAREHTVKGCAAGRTQAVARRTRHTDHSVRKAGLVGLCLPRHRAPLDSRCDLRVLPREQRRRGPRKGSPPAMRSS